MINLETQRLSHVGTVRRWVTSAKTARSLETIVKSSVRTVIRVCRPASHTCIELHFADKKTVGHTKVRCKEPIKEVDDGGFGTGGDTGGFDAAAGGEDVAAPAAGGGDAWAVGSGGATDEWGTAPAATTVGGGGQSDW